MNIFPMNLSRRRQVAAVVVAAIALALGIGLYKYSSVAHSNTQRTDVDVEAGDLLCRIGGHQWAAGGRRGVVLFTSATCNVCRGNGNRNFEVSLIDEARRRQLPVDVVISSDASKSEHQALARRFGEHGATVFRSSPSAIGVSRLPAFFLVDENGSIVSRWVGAVQEERRGALIQEILDGARLEQYGRISRLEFTEALHGPGAKQVVALSEPAPFLLRDTKYRVIPMKDVEIRAHYELDPERTVFLDCATASSPYSCQTAAFELTVLGFGHVIAVDLPRRSLACASAG